MEPHVYTASAWTTEPSEVVVVHGAELRELCETNKHIGYQVAKGIGEVMSRRFDEALGGRSEKTVRASGLPSCGSSRSSPSSTTLDLEAIGRYRPRSGVRGC